MADDRDPGLQSLFRQANAQLDGEAFTAQLMTRTRNQRLRVVAGWSSVALLLLACIWLLVLPLQEFAQLMTLILTSSLIDLGEGWLSWFLLPINNIGSVLVLSIKLMRMGSKKFRRASYVN